ncbi:MAG: hypothetical protein RXO22_05050 [Thermocladium sp.]
MPITYKCKFCGFVLYNDDTKIKSHESIKKQWGYMCPVCMSPLNEKSNSIKWVFQ